MASAFQLIPINAYFLLFGCVEVVEGPQAFRPKKRCPKNDVFFVFLGSYGGGKRRNGLGLGQIGILVR